MIGVAAWQWLLDGLGWFLSRIYELIGNYGITIIVLTVVIRVILLPLGIKQIRSMQHMQLVQPKVKQVQQRYKQNKQRQQEEIMKLYKEYGVNPLSGCWPTLLQFPILIAMYSVLRFPQHPIHIPEDSSLYDVITQQIPLTMPDGTPITTQAQINELDLPGPDSGTHFLGMNLLCSPGFPWQDAPDSLQDRTKVDGEQVTLSYPVDCAKSQVERIPYYVFVLLMFGTTFYQQRQTQNAQPVGAVDPRQQSLMKLMPIMFGVFGFFFPSGLVLYWTTSNAWQIGQQYFMLKSRPTAEQLAERARQNEKSKKKGFMSSLTERADQERKRRDQGRSRPSSPDRRPKPTGSGGGKDSGRKGTGAKGSGGTGQPGKGKPRPKPETGEDGGGDPGHRPER
ncbi:MAG TPA: YidC/Oxa1 family membrane protein insertase [Actinomycetota bacterium]|nr:YidC/Oxa1 family membrane protein insertase [Actinomycetota bacterium]